MKFLLCFSIFLIGATTSQAEPSKYSPTAKTNVSSSKMKKRLSKNLYSCELSETKLVSSRIDVANANSAQLCKKNMQLSGAEILLDMNNGIILLMNQGEIVDGINTRMGINGRFENDRGNFYFRNFEKEAVYESKLGTGSFSFNHELFKSKNKNQWKRGYLAWAAANLQCSMKVSFESCKKVSLR